jgi:hypothetical protein
MLRGRVATLKNAIVLHLEPVRGDASDVGFDLSPRRNVLPWSLFLQWNVISKCRPIGRGRPMDVALRSDTVPRPCWDSSNPAGALARTLSFRKSECVLYCCCSPD